MQIFLVSNRIDQTIKRIVCFLFVVLIAVPLWSQTEPEAPTEVVKLYNGWQFSVYAGGSLFYTNGGYKGTCNCNFEGDVTSINAIFGASLNIPVHQDFALYLRAGVNNASTVWSSARSDSLLSTVASGYVVSEWNFEYNILNVDLLFRLIGSMDGERVYIGPSFGIVTKKHVRISDTELQTGFSHIVEDGPLDIDHSLRVSMVIGAEYAFVPFKNLYIVPAFEVDYAFGKILQERSARPNFTLRPTYYKLLVTFAYQFL